MEDISNMPVTCKDTKMALKLIKDVHILITNAEHRYKKIIHCG